MGFAKSILWRLQLKELPPYKGVITGTTGTTKSSAAIVPEVPVVPSKTYPCGKQRLAKKTFFSQIKQPPV